MISEQFKNAILREGSLCNVICEWCGRTHYVTGSEAGDYGEGELEELIKLEAENPDLYVEWDTSIPGGYFCGRYVVIGCPCNEEKLKPYENFIWQHRYLIVEYLVQRAKLFLDDSMIQNDIVSEIKILMEKIDSQKYRRIVNKGGV